MSILCSQEKFHGFWYTCLTLSNPHQDGTHMHTSFSQQDSWVHKQTLCLCHTALSRMVMVGCCDILQQTLIKYKIFQHPLCNQSKRKKRNPVEEYTDWSIVPMKGQVIIYFPLVFKFHQPKFHLPMQLSCFKKNSQESIKQYQEEKEVR